MMKCKHCNGRGDFNVTGILHDPYKIKCASCRGTGRDVECEDAIAAAVAAERRRVWDLLTLWPSEEDESANRSVFRVEAFRLARHFLFPDGEPKELNPPAGERRGSE